MLDIKQACFKALNIGKAVDNYEKAPNLRTVGIKL